MAQEVEQVLPQLVNPRGVQLADGQHFRTVDYSKLSAVLVEAVKEQQSTIDELQQRNRDLEERLQRLEKLLLPAH